GSDRRRGGRRRPRRPAHPEHPRTPAALQTSAESPPEIRAHVRNQEDRHGKTPGHRIRTRLLLAHSPGHHPPGRRNRPAPAGPRTVEPRAVPAATRGPQPCPDTAAAITKTDSETETEHQDQCTPVWHKRLKSVVLISSPASGRWWRSSARHWTASTSASSPTACSMPCPPPASSAPPGSAAST